MITNKTGVLIASALKIGAIIANASEEDTQSIYDFGKNIGIAFQIMDDYLDVFGNQEHVGKNKLATYTKTKKQYYTSWQKDILPQRKAKNWIFGIPKNLIILIKYIVLKKFLEEQKLLKNL